jgi:hypothetical protein
VSFVELVPAAETHIAPIAERMRAADIMEAGAFGFEPRQALWIGLKGSVDCLTALVDDEPVAMMGLTPTNIAAGLGSPWLLGTEDIYANPRAMLALGPRVLSIWSDSTPRLENLVAVENTPAIRMLRRWGCSIGDKRTMIRGVEFVTFTWERR